LNWGNSKKPLPDPVRKRLRCVAFADRYYSVVYGSSAIWRERLIATVSMR